MNSSSCASQPVALLGAKLGPGAVSARNAAPSVRPAQTRPASTPPMSAPAARRLPDLNFDTSSDTRTSPSLPVPGSLTAIAALSGSGPTGAFHGKYNPRIASGKCLTGRARQMSESVDSSNVVIQPPIAWALAIVAGLAAGWLYPWPFVPMSIPRAWVGGGVLAAGFALATWAIVPMHNAGTRVQVHEPTTTIVAHAPYRFTRNPIYICILLVQQGLAIRCDNLCM